MPIQSQSLLRTKLATAVLFLILWTANSVTIDVLLPLDNSEPSQASEEKPSLILQADGSETVGQESVDKIEDSFYDPVQADPDCDAENKSDASCYQPPDSTLEVESTSVPIDATCSYGGEDPDARVCDAIEEKVVDKHWGSDPNILRMRDTLRKSGSGASHIQKNHRPPIFLLPGLASTRLVAWRFKSCPHHPLLSDIKVQDYVWLNINLIMQMGTIDVSCMKECLRLGWNQSDTDDVSKGCKLRPDEGLDAISSLSPGGVGSQLLIGGTNTVYAWLIQWLADNLGYDVTNIVGLPYDWRLSPDKMQARDGFLTLTRRRIEAAVQSNGKPGIMVAHSMGNTVFRYFLEWLRTELREEAYQKYVRQAERRAQVLLKAGPDVSEQTASYLTGWMSGVVSSLDEWWTFATKKRLPSERHDKLWELAFMEGDANWYEWIEQHIWTYVGLSAPMLGAVNPLRAVISGENMGLPVPDASARVMEVTFGSTHTVNPISSKEGFCDDFDFDEWDEEAKSPERHADSKLACLDDIVSEIESKSTIYYDPWKNFPALKSLLVDREDWDTDIHMIQIIKELCGEKEKSPCAKNITTNIGPRNVESGDIFIEFCQTWKEVDEPLDIKREQLRESFWDTNVPNILNKTWERPLIKHVVMAYGVDTSTEVGYQYVKQERLDEKKGNMFDGVPGLRKVIWETAGGRLEEETVDSLRGGLTDMLTKKKPRRILLRKGHLKHSGDGSVPYLSLSWAHTWLLHGARARRYSNDQSGNPLEDIKISHRPKGATEWKDGPPPKSITILEEKRFEESSDTGTAHPHGTKYKPEMVRYHSSGKSRTTGIEYTTTVIEAIGVEHKETTRNYDILAAVFTDVLRRMSDDLNIV